MGLSLVEKAPVVGVPFRTVPWGTKYISPSDYSMTIKESQEIALARQADSKTVAQPVKLSGCCLAGWLAVITASRNYCESSSPR